ncbi:MAG: twin-arginine translocase TatA/TatE family subunit [Flavobacteriales bacterium]|nr:twin-arginine translocase TatA/TatE family subunit [Flavobacteriales bacterium]
MNSTLLFLNLGGGEIIVVLLIVLLFFGSKKIPELARGLGRGMREFKDATSGVQREIEESMRDIPDKPKRTPPENSIDKSKE